MIGENLYNRRAWQTIFKFFFSLIFAHFFYFQMVLFFVTTSFLRLTDCTVSDLADWLANSHQDKIYPEITDIKVKFSSEISLLYIHINSYILISDLLQSLINAAKEYKITFVYSLSPGLDITYSSDKEVQAIKDKFDQVFMLIIFCNLKN